MKESIRWRRSLDELEHYEGDHSMKESIMKESIIKEIIR